jgi:hypothetical protein
MHCEVMVTKPKSKGNMKPIGFVLFVAMLAALPGMAAPIACPTTGTYQTLLNTNAAGGCTISPAAGELLTFSSFTFTPSGFGTPTAAQMTYTLDDPGTAPGGQSTFGFVFSPGLAVIGSSGTPNDVQDIGISYLVVPTGTSIISDHLVQTAAASGGGIGKSTENLTFCIASDPNNTSGTCRVFPGNPLTTTTPANLRADVSFGQWTSMTATKDINVSSGAFGGIATISQVEEAVDVTAAAAVPEPSSYGLVGLAIIALGFVTRLYSAIPKRN